MAHGLPGEPGADPDPTAPNPSIPSGAVDLADPIQQTIANFKLTMGQQSGVAAVLVGMTKTGSIMTAVQTPQGGLVQALGLLELAKAVIQQQQQKQMGEGKMTRYEKVGTRERSGGADTYLDVPHKVWDLVKEYNHHVEFSNAVNVMAAPLLKAVYDLGRQDEAEEWIAKAEDEPLGE